jgi:hypothetical protein
MQNVQTDLQIIQIPSFPGEEGEGILSVLEAKEGLPFPVERVFTVTGMGKGMRRGGHSNIIVNEAICCLQGAIEVSTLTSIGRNVYLLDEPTKYLVVPCMTWADIEALENNTCYLVIADHTFQEAAPCYIRDLSQHHAMLQDHGR